MKSSSDAPVAAIKPSNPFSTRFIRPGAGPYLFTNGESAERLIAKLELLGGCAQIVGPHGTGKSSLLLALAEAMQAAGRRVICFSLHDGKRRMPADWLAQSRERMASVVFVDGYEQLGRWQRARLRSQCRAGNWSLLVTTHNDRGLPTLATTQPSLELAQQVVARLLRGDAVSLPATTVRAAFQSAAGNLRETLFALYDAYEIAAK